jgi:hypothetical protein
MEAGPLFPLQTLPVAPWRCCPARWPACCAARWPGSCRPLYKVEDWFHRLPIHWMWWPALGGLAVGIGGYFQPRALGVGYDVIGDLLHNHMALGAVLALLASRRRSG